MFSLLRLFRRKRTERSRLRTRPCIEPLEERSVPAVHAAAAKVAVDAHAEPFAANAPWEAKNVRSFVVEQSGKQLREMYFNSPSSYDFYSAHFRGVLAGWVRMADAKRLVTDAQLLNYLGQRERRYFVSIRPVLADLYPGRSEETYSLLMAMNLASGYYTYGTAYGSDRTIAATLNLRVGDCSEIADLLAILIRAQGIPVQEVQQSYDYMTPLGRFVASHQVDYAGGLWLDAEINTAFRFTFTSLLHVKPAERLPDLLSSKNVLGFYNWYLNPAVRQSQLEHGLDGGILSFYYEYYLAGINRGMSQVSLVNPDIM